MTQHRSFTAQQRLQIVLEGLQGDSVAEVCRRHQVSPTLFYRWRDQLFSQADRIFSKADPGPGARQAAHEAELARLRAVITEITTENLELKKTLGPSRIRPGFPPSSGR